MEARFRVYELETPEIPERRRDRILVSFSTSSSLFRVSCTTRVTFNGQHMSNLSFAHADYSGYSLALKSTHATAASPPIPAVFTLVIQCISPSLEQQRVPTSDREDMGGYSESGHLKDRPRHHWDRLPQIFLEGLDL